MTDVVKNDDRLKNSEGTDSDVENRLEEADKASTGNNGVGFLKFRGLPEAQGFAAISAARGAIVLSNLYLSTSFLVLATMEAGCPSCRTRYGFRASSLITIIAVISGLSSAFFLPIIGAVIDFTPHRRRVGIITGIVFALIQTVQIGTVSKTWFIMSVLQVIAGVLFEIQGSISHAYLPELHNKINNEEIMGNLVGQFTMILHGSELGYVVIVIVVGTIWQLDAIVTAHFSQALNVLCVVPLFYVGWCRTFPEVPVLHSHNAENTSLISAGFKQIWNTSKGIYKHYADTLGLFFLAVAFANAGANSLVIISVTYQVQYLALTSIQIGINFVIVLSCGMIGAMASTYPMKKTNPSTSLKVNLIAFAISMVLSGIVLTGPEAGQYMALFAGIWGLLFGWHHTAIPSFFSMSLPQGQQAELSGFFFYSRLILTWLPSFIFTIMNEAGVDMKYGLMSIASYFLIALVILCRVASWETVVAKASEQSKNIVWNN